MASSRKKPARKPRKPFDFAKRSKASLASLSGKTAGGASEKTLHYHCKAWLDKAGLWGRLLIFHVANERKGSVGAAVHFKRMGVRPGVADWLVFVPGRSVAIELKDDKGKQGADQERFQRQWEAAGNLYFVVRTLAEFQGIIDALTLF